MAGSVPSSPYRTPHGSRINSRVPSTPYHTPYASRTNSRRFDPSLNATTLTETSRGICIKAVVILVIAIGAIALVTGVLALLASKGVLPYTINNLQSLAEIGDVNSSLMIGAGFVLVVLGFVGWTRHLWKEQHEELRTRSFYLKK